MADAVQKIRDFARVLLDDSKVDVVLGFKRGSLPGMSEPALIRNSAEVDELIWDATCRLNLCNYLTNRKDKIGIVAKACDTRNIVGHIVENKISRDQLVIIGVPCTGMADKKALADLVGGELTAYAEAGDEITVNGPLGEKKVKKGEVLQNNCQTCIRRNPVIYDELAGEAVAELELSDRFADVNKVEAMDAKARWDYVEDLLSGCTRCYACKNACPLCYCPQCFVDESRPQWVGKGTNPIDIRTYHFLRAFHCAGRCTDCGACEAACPMDIKMRFFTRKNIKDCLENYGWETGLKEGVRPPLDTFKTDDQETFIR
ncbi:4Fe-4S ferredoxin [Desulfococcaceae bacterium OttesenSCG-928-F15]|nr:4Fe-4S ferredoxin [Desulfococcaceae bacterium OttesenSCG-928-F15]